jgi:ketosteroid isomerase-like protein
MSDPEPLIIGLKYCGGCKPDYDRVALVEEIRKQLGPSALFVRPDGEAVDVILAVQGCPTACADLTPFGGKAVRLITSPEDAKAFVRYVENRFRKETAMTLSREEIQHAMEAWNLAWERYDIEGVLSLMHDDVLFENWTGGQAKGKEALRQAWQPWFAQGGFRFIEEELFIDEAQQKVLFRWLLEWPCREKGHQGMLERRRGVDVMHFKDGKMINKLTYSKTTVEIDGQRHTLHL